MKTKMDGNMNFTLVTVNGDTREANQYFYQAKCQAGEQINIYVVLPNMNSNGFFGKYIAWSQGYWNTFEDNTDTTSLSLT